MRKLLAVAAAVALLQTASMAQASGISFNINVGGPPIVISQPPEFIYPSELGFGVAVGVPYDMFYNSGIYYIYRGGGWYRTSSYGGSWVKIRHRELPPELRRYKIAKIHEFRDREYRSYSRDRNHYQGKRFIPAVKGREENRGMRGNGNEGRQDVRGQRPDERRDNNERRPDERGGERRDQGHDR